MDLVEAYTWARARYGEDIAQQAADYAIQAKKTESGAYLNFQAKILWLIGHHDGRGPATIRTMDQRARRHPERVSAMDLVATRRPLWARQTDPFRIVAAREALSRVPVFIVHWHVDYGFIWRRRCVHAQQDGRVVRPHILPSGKRLVLCQACRTASMQHWRTGHRRRRCQDSLGPRR